MPQIKPVSVIESQNIIRDLKDILRFSIDTSFCPPATMCEPKPPSDLKATLPGLLHSPFGTIRYLHGSIFIKPFLTFSIYYQARSILHSLCISQDIALYLSRHSIRRQRKDHNQQSSEYLHRKTTSIQHIYISRLQSAHIYFLLNQFPGR